MSTVALLLALAGSAAVPSPPAPPADWAALPRLEVPAALEPLSAYVRDEVRAGRCTAPAGSPQRAQLSVELAVLVGEDGSVRRILPRAIGCATVEQYATGLASRLIRRPLAVPGSDTWYRTSMDFAWTR